LNHAEISIYPTVKETSSSMYITKVVDAIKKHRRHKILGNFNGNLDRNLEKVFEASKIIYVDFLGFFTS
jgi:uncharacterized protein YqgV (UPF0045/DUF77 family)